MIGRVVSIQARCYPRLRCSLRTTFIQVDSSGCAAAAAHVNLEGSITPLLGCTTRFASSSSSSGGASGGETDKDKIGKKNISDFMEPTATNPASFRRGQGPIDDPRDVGQEMYWKYRHNLVEGDEERASSSNDEAESTSSSRSNASDTPSNGTADKFLKEQNESRQHELPSDLIQFLEHVGPLKQTFDKEKSTPRAVELQEEIEKSSKEEGGSTRSQQHEQRAARRRERMSMPLMGDDDEYTAVRNTNFARQTPERDGKPAFGTTGLQFYDLLSMYQSKQKEIGSDAAKCEIDSIVEAFYKKHTASAMTKSQDENEQGAHQEDLPWTQEEQERHKDILKQTLQLIELPVLMKDSEGNFLGIPFDDVPPPEIKAVQPVPSFKMKLVMEDWIEQQQRLHSQQEQRRARIAVKHDERRKARTNK